jgi:hypothetical protein
MLLLPLPSVLGEPALPIICFVLSYLATLWIHRSWWR